MTTRILFICKNREFAPDYCVDDYSNEYTYSSGGKSSGLYNSVKFVVDMLTENGIECKQVDVVDNNCIDKEVNAYKPTHVMIEALWVVPDKFAVLTRLHPKVKWFVRLHSDIPFIANEGIAMEWIAKSMQYENVYVAANSSRIASDLRAIYNKQVPYLPNYYPIEKVTPPDVPISVVYQERKLNAFQRMIAMFLNRLSSETEEPHDGDLSDEVHIGCFGAVRPLKNQLIQAVAAIRFADRHGKKLYFHINGNRIEGKGDPVLKNIRKLFESVPRHELVEHAWMPHHVFTQLLKSMDITMQVSFTETYNIVAADAVAAMVPVLTSPEIDFIGEAYHVDPTDSDEMVEKLELIYATDKRDIANTNYQGLLKDALRAKAYWLSMFKE